MARILEALNHTDRHAQTVVDASESTPPVSAEAAEEIPFIEIGGGQIQASPTVLAVKIPRRANATPLAVSGAAPTVLFRPVALGCPFRPAKERFSPDLIAFHDPEHLVSRQYQELAQGLRAESAAPHVLLFSGALGVADAAVVVLNLALTYARPGGPRFVVVDATGPTACAAAKLGLLPAPGLQDVFAGSVPLLRALQQTGVPNFHLLAAGEFGGPPRLAVRSLRDTLAQLRKRFELVLVIAPAWEQGTDRIAAGAACDAAYLIVPRDRAESPELNELLRALPRQGVALCGCVLVQSER